MLSPRHALTLSSFLLLTACAGGASAPTPPGQALGQSAQEPERQASREHLYAMLADHTDANLIGFFDPGCCTGDSPTHTLGTWTGNAPLIEGPVLDAEGNAYVIPYAQGTLSLAEFNAPFLGSRQQPTRQTPLSGLTWSFHDTGNGITIGAHDKLFIADYDENAVLVYAPPYTGAPMKITDGVNHPVWVGLTSSDVLFVANAGNASITEYEPPYISSPADTISTIPWTPTKSTFALDGTGKLFVADPTTNAIREYTQPYAAPKATIVTGIAGPIGMATDSGGNLFVVNTVVPLTSQSVVEYAPPYTGAPKTAFELFWQKGPCCDAGTWMQGEISVR